MSVKKSLVVLAVLAGASLLGGCLSIYEGRESICRNGDPNSDSWPYCGSAPPGGPQPVDRPDYGPFGG